MTVWYEWAIELTDTETGDIRDVNHVATYAEAKAWAVNPDPGYAFEIALTRCTGNDEDGMTDRQYAYVEDGKLPATFDGGRNVPRRFLKEVG